MNPILLDVECIVCNKTLQKINHVPQGPPKIMGKVGNRRSRTPNWSAEEKAFLLELIRRKKEVVVTKANNGPNNYEEKDAAWREILGELAAKFGNKFSESSTKKVKTQWQNMKRIAREELAARGSLETRLSFEVCQILESFGATVKQEPGESSSTPTVTVIPDIQVKAEREDDDLNRTENASEGMNAEDVSEENDIIMNESSSPGRLEIITDSEAIDCDDDEYEGLGEYVQNKVDVSCMTDSPMENPFQKELKEYLKFSSAEKQLRLESLTEERHVVRTMRETAELNKIIAEQRLKHLLWTKKQQTWES